MFKKTKKEDQQIPQKFQELLPANEAKRLRDQKFNADTEYDVSKEQIVRAINEYVECKRGFPRYLYDNQGKQVFALHPCAKAEAEEEGYRFTRDSKGCIMINFKE